MNKKGFTLIEVLGVVIIIASVALLVLPNVINRFSNQKSDIIKTNKEIIISAAKLYVSDNKDDYVEPNNTYCITIKQLIDNKYLDSKVIDITNNQSIANNYAVKAFSNPELNNILEYDVVKIEDCN